MRRLIAVWFLPLAVGISALPTMLGVTAAQGAPQASGDYIVVLKAGIDSAAIASKHKQKFGAELSFVYTHAIKGYAARLSASGVTAVEADTNVVSVYIDGLVQATQDQPPQVVGNNVLRIDGDESSTRSGDGSGIVNVNVAVLDDSRDVSHPDLNAAGGADCLRGNRVNGRPKSGVPTPEYHGTMVGGFIAALDNGIGRVGVAPGARLWAIRVLDDEGFGYTSEVICGLDWVTATRTDSDPTNDIAVANMSLGGSLGCPAGKNGRCPPGRETEGTCAATKNPMHIAVCRTVASGATVVAAAGNEAQDLQTQEPATFSEVLAVTAMGDRDGQPGGLGGQFMCDPLSFDDVATYWSNFSTLPEDQSHTVSASGECIASTFPGGLYAVGSGTSFSTPSVTGVVALCIASGPCAGLTPAQIVQKVVADAATYNQSNTGYGYQGDPLRPISGKYYGYLIRAGLY